jgi:hypothetical protein
MTISTTKHTTCRPGRWVELLRHNVSIPHPKVNRGAGDDYQYDEAQDFGAS